MQMMQAMQQMDMQMQTLVNQMGGGGFNPQMMPGSGFMNGQGANVGNVHDVNLDPSLMQPDWNPFNPANMNGMNGNQAGMGKGDGKGDGNGKGGFRGKPRDKASG